jgi:hypothetical protein
MIYTWSGAHVKELSVYVTTDENLKELTEGMFARAKILYPDTEKDEEVIISVASTVYIFKADGGWQEIQDALNNG